MSPTPLERSPTSPGTLQAALAALALAAMAVYRASAAVVDPDLWHEMALFREALALGHLPLRDSFAYTPTVEPSVHHEWGAGAIAHGVAKWLGGGGLIALRYALLFGLGGVSWQVARARGAPHAIVAPLAMPALLMADAAFSAVRAQMYSLVLLAALLYGLERDRRGERGWIALWLLLYVVWENVHAGFLVGAGLFFLHWLEQWLRGEPHRHLLATGIAMIGLVFATPYHVHYPAYLARAVTMARPHVGEWGGLWTSDSAALVSVYAASLLLVAYCGHAAGWRRLRGLPLVLATALYALHSRRMVALYAVVWLCYAPGYLAATPLGDRFQRLWSRRALQIGFWSAALLVFSIAALPAQPWRLRVPGDRDARLKPAHVVYPVGAVDYLGDRRFTGNVLVGFDWGAYVSWKLHPRVRVSLDSRYEVAYAPEIEAEQYAFFQAEDGWSDLLADDRYRATDVILAPRFLSSRIHEHLAQLPRWKRVYRDKMFELFARAESDLPLVDRPGEATEGTFP